MTNFSIKAFNGSIQNQSVQLINARELHESLKVKTKFQDWINRRLLNGYFRKDVDFLNVLRFENVKTGLLGSREVEIKDYHLTLDTAKHLCLMENTEIGYQIRQQFIDNDNKARAELARLKQHLIGIPTFLRNNPDEL
ncbi:phage antirepressor protein, partial [Haemophilus aegyptius ATCC 11116]